MSAFACPSVKPVSDAGHKQKQPHAVGSLLRHWPEYLMEAAGLGFFMISACVFTTLLEHPASLIHRYLPSPLTRRLLMGLAMGLTAIAIMYSPWGKRSGAHLNPSVTLAFMRLGKIAQWDGVFYILAQFAGGILGVLVAALFLMKAVAHPSVMYAVTQPGSMGVVWAFAAEGFMAFGMMTMVLIISNTPTLNRWTGIWAGLLIANYILWLAPLSGMSINPARTLASALPGRVLDGLWIYFTAPVAGMLAAAESYKALFGSRAVLCAKLHHDNPMRCIFRCNYGTVKKQ